MGKSKIKVEILEPTSFKRTGQDGSVRDEDSFGRTKDESDKESIATRFKFLNSLLATKNPKDEDDEDKFHVQR